MHLPPDIAYRRLVYDATRVEAWQALLSEEEHTRMHTFGAAKRRREFLLGRVAARTLLAERLSCTPAEVPLRVAADGAVEVDRRSLFVSITHSGDQAAAAIAEQRVGVDLERIRPLRAGIERFLLHPDEASLLDRLPLNRTRALILCWTLKEAALKACRTGLRTFPSRLRLKVDVARHVASVSEEKGAVWQVTFEEWDGAYLAVAF